jgi:hypothetical protein
MAHFAELNEDNIVQQVIVIHNNELLDENGNESEQKGIDFCVNLYGGRWVQTSYNGSFRKNFAGLGSLYDPIRDAFIYPQPYPSWVLNEETCKWEAPIPAPSVTAWWNEELQKWQDWE